MYRNITLTQHSEDKHPNLNMTSNSLHKSVTCVNMHLIVGIFFCRTAQAHFASASRRTERDLPYRLPNRRSGHGPITITFTSKRHAVEKASSSYSRFVDQHGHLHTLPRHHTELKCRTRETHLFILTDNGDKHQLAMQIHTGTMTKKAIQSLLLSPPPTLQHPILMGFYHLGESDFFFFPGQQTGLCEKRTSF